MTCKEKLRKDYPNLNEQDINDIIINSCPSHYHILNDPSDGCSSIKCSICWDREIPETSTVSMPVNKKTNKKTNDNVNHPSHYTQGGVECIDALAAATEGLIGIEAVCTANAIKYLWRWKYKNGKEDLCKAKWYIDRLIKNLES